MAERGRLFSPSIPWRGKYENQNRLKIEFLTQVFVHVFSREDRPLSSGDIEIKPASTAPPPPLPLPQVTISHDCGGGAGGGGAGGGGGISLGSATSFFDDHHHAGGAGSSFFWQQSPSPSSSSALRIGRSQSLTPTVGQRQSLSDASSPCPGAGGGGGGLGGLGASAPGPWGSKMRSNSLTLGGPAPGHFGARRESSYPFFDFVGKGDDVGGSPWMRGEDFNVFVFH